MTARRHVPVLSRRPSADPTHRRSDNGGQFSFHVVATSPLQTLAAPALSYLTAQLHLSADERSLPIDLSSLSVVHCGTGERLGRLPEAVGATHIILLDDAPDDVHCTDDETMIGYTLLCHRLVDTGRPVVAYVHLCPVAYAASAAPLRVLRHEFIHAIGFTADTWAYYDPYDHMEDVLVSNALPYQPHEFLVYHWGDKPRNIVTKDYLLTASGPTRYLRDYFNCNKAKGVAVDPVDLAHFYAPHHDDDLMTPTLDANTTQAESPLAMDVLGSSPWYETVGLLRADEAPTVWGRGLGCDFLRRNCEEYTRRHPHKTPYCHAPIEGVCVFEGLPNGTVPSKHQYTDPKVDNMGGHVELNYCVKRTNWALEARQRLGL